MTEEPEDPLMPLREVISLESRCRRLMKFLEWEVEVAPGKPRAPPTIIGAEIDLVRQALDRVETRHVPDHEKYREMRRAAKEEMDREIAEIGEEAWLQRASLEFDEPEGSA